MWIPEWLGIPYCLLYAKYGRRGFTLEEARAELDMPLPRLIKVLSELGRRGFLTSETRDKTRTYWLSSFDSLARGIRAEREMRGVELAERLKAAYKEYGMKYLIVGASSAFFYHAYQFPAKLEVKVFREDYGFWRNVLPGAELIPGLTREEFEEREEADGFFVAPPERVVVEGLKRRGVASTLDSVAVIISRSLDWEKLVNHALEQGVVRELGAVLEILDGELRKEYGRSMIPGKIIDELLTHVEKKGRMRRYPRAVLNEDKTYRDVGEKWRLRLYLPSYVIRNPVNDLAPFVLGGM